MNETSIQCVIFDFMGVMYDSRTQQLMTGVGSFLQQITKANISCGVASSSNHNFIEQFITEQNLQQYFSVIVGGDDVEITKPNPECFLKVVEFFKTQPEHCLVIDDSIAPVLAAKEAGFQTVLFGIEVQTFDELQISKI